MSGKILAPSKTTGLVNDPNDATNLYGDITAQSAGTKRGLHTVNLGSAGLAISIDEPSSSVTYIGQAVMGTATSAASWQIKKITVSGTVTSITWADANDSFDNIWDNRASLSYS
jgi:hypothetical protein